MDISFWNSLAADSITFNHTSKQYFRKYFWRLEVCVPGARIVKDSTDPFEVQIERRRLWAARNASTYKNPYWLSRTEYTNTIDVPTLEKLSSVIQDTCKNIRVRIEEPYVQFYAEFEQEIKDVATALNMPSIIRSVTGPENDDTQNILAQGCIIIPKDNGYQYKVILRDGRYSTHIKQSILAYLNQLGSDVKIPPGAYRILSNKYDSMWGVKFYVRDQKLALFLDIMSPGVVSQIHPLVVAKNK